MTEKRPREYASEIMLLNDRAARKQAFEKTPDHLKPLIKKHCEITQRIKNRKKIC